MENASVSSIQSEKTQLVPFILNISEQSRRKKDAQCALVRDHTPLKSKQSDSVSFIRLLNVCHCKISPGE